MLITLLEEMLSQATDQMPPAFAQKLLAIRASEDLLTRIGELRSKANSGQLTVEEDAEYKEFIEALEILSLLQLKAKQIVDISG